MKHYPIMRWLLILFLPFQFCFGQIQNSIHKMDSVPQVIIGDWYLSGTSFYESDYTQGKGFYVAADDVYHLKITEDSIFFISPPTRFYHSTTSGYKYELIYDSLLEQMDLISYHQRRKKKWDLRWFTVEHSGSELRLKEYMSSKGFDEVHITNCAIYQPTIDSIQIEHQLHGIWQSGPEMNLFSLETSDTITLIKLNEHERVSGFELTFGREKGKLYCDFFQSEIIHETPNINIDLNSGRIYGIVDGVVFKNQEINCSLDILSKTLTLGFRTPSVYEIISITEDQLVLKVLQK